MKTIFKILWGFFAVCGILALVGVCFLVPFSKRVNISYNALGLYEERADSLRNAAPYVADTTQFHIRSVQDSARAAEIRAYFRLDTLYDANASTWENTLALAKFVSSNIPHANQAIQPEKRNAIALWEYSKTVEPAFNCRLHSIMLYELLTSVGITATYITCLPQIDDGDCHVVDHVWLPEYGKWAMIDSDMVSYATDKDGTPLSLAEIRERLIADEDIYFHENYGKGSKKLCYYKAYLTKNTYWFSCWETIHYDQEPSAYNPDAGRYINLVPPGFTLPSSIGDGEIVTSDAGQFWAAP